MKNFIKRYMYLIGCWMLGAALHDAGIGFRSLHFWDILFWLIVVIVGWDIAE